MKVALIDNMNNNFFSLARYLRDIGIDAHLYITTSTKQGINKHFIPENDTNEKINDLNYIYDFPVSYNWKLLYWQPSLSMIHNQFKDYDSVIAAGFSIAFLYKSRIKIDIAIPSGSDFFDLPIRVNNSFQEFIRYIMYKRFQRLGFQATNYIISNKDHFLMKSASKKLDVNLYDLAIPMVYNEENYISDIWSFLSNNDFIVFNHSRQIWKTNCGLPIDDFKNFGGNKRNDKIITAFASFINFSSFKNPILVLFEYGVDVSFSKKLIKDLKIDNYVKWMPKLSRKNILAGLKLADFAVDQMRNNIVGIGGTSLESMAMGIPTITYTNGVVIDPHSYYYQAPFLDILESHEIESLFKDFEINKEKYKRIGIQSKKWYNDKVGKGIIYKYIELLT
jgi:glycosyltransferase involved in cell wall biosynthesis